jgi:hypothetical protein
MLPMDREKLGKATLQLCDLAVSMLVGSVNV